MPRPPLQYVKCLLFAAALACAACGEAGKTGESAPAAYPSPSPRGGTNVNGISNQAETLMSAERKVEVDSDGDGLTDAVDGPHPPPEAIRTRHDLYTFADDPVAAGGFAPNSATNRPAPRPPPPPAPAKPATSPTDQKIANVDIERASSTAPNPTPTHPTTSTAASTDVTPHKSDFLIYTAQITMAVYQVEPGLAAVEQIGRDLGGYLAVRNDTSITIRVPRASFDEAIRRIGLTGDVVHKEVSAEDVTDKYVDMEARLRNAKAMRDRLQDLLQHATVKEAIEIQEQLGKVTEVIEVLEGELKLMRDKIAYSSIAVNFSARGAGALQEMPLRLPFPWLQELGLPRLMSLHE